VLVLANEANMIGASFDLPSLASVLQQMLLSRSITSTSTVSLSTSTRE
jgi:hypothetical protein